MFHGREEVTEVDHPTDHLVRGEHQLLRVGWKELRHRYCGGGWWPTSQARMLFDPETMSTTRYRYRGSVIPSPWSTA